MTTNLVGQRIANYQITALLGQGRIGMVYQAIDLEDQRQVALKVVSLHLAQQPGFRQRFLQEVQAIPRLEHPSIIKVYEAGVDTAQDILYMTMDYVAGRSLTAYLQQLQWNNQALLLGDTLMFVSQVADALDYAHQRGVLHRDIRPNVVLFKQEEDEAGEPVRRAAIADFGLNTLIQAEKEPFKPSLPYMSPEQCLGQDLDGRSDIYSLGILLYELVVGQRPFTINDLDEARRLHPYEDPPSPQELRPELPAAVVAIILKAIAKRRSDRYQTSSDFAEALRQSALELPETLAAPSHEAEIERVDTHFESDESAAVASQWFSHDDKLTITQDVPYSLSRQIVTIGRDENNDIVLNGNSITRRHAQLERTATGWQIRDLGSKNGTYLDGTALLPDIPAEWNSYQTLRIGPYFLQIQPGKGFAFNAHPLLAEASPDEIEVLPGKQQVIQLAVLNQGQNAEEFRLQVDRLPPEWVTLPNGAVTLQPGDQATMPILIHPPLSRDIIPGKMRYLLTIQPTTANRDQLVVPGVVNVQPAADIFSIELETEEIDLKGVTRLTVRNEGIDDRAYSVVGQNEEDAVRFGEWRAKQQAAPSASGGFSLSSPSAPRGASILNRLSFVRRLRSAPRTYFSRMMSVPRRWLNALLPGLGGAVRMPSFPSQRPSAPKLSAPKLPAFSREGKEEVVFPHDLQTQITIPAGQEASLFLSMAARKRPLFGRADHSLPFELRVFTPSSKHQIAKGQVHVRPRVRVRGSTTLSLLAIFILLLIGGYLCARYLNPTLGAMLTAPRDMDEDGLGNLAEVYRYGTDPNEPDEDGDDLLDGQEIALRSNPHLADTDEDDLSDGRERELGTDLLVADTDGDELSDGLEVKTLLTDPLVPNEAVVWFAPTAVPTPTPLPTATPRPTLTPTPSPITRQETIVSVAGEDGFIGGQDGALGIVLVSDGNDLRVGDSFDNAQQFKSILSFDTALIPDEAMIDDVQLRLHQNATTGQPFSLGQVHVDIAPLAGFGGDMTLALGDFAADTAVLNATTLTFSGDIADAFLPPPILETINRQGRTQFRLYFTLSSNNNGSEDWLSFYAADEANAAVQPQLIVTYTVP